MKKVFLILFILAAFCFAKTETYEFAYQQVMGLESEAMVAVPAKTKLLIADEASGQTIQIITDNKSVFNEKYVNVTPMQKDMDTYKIGYYQIITQNGTILYLTENGNSFSIQTKSLGFFTLYFNITTK